MQAYRWVRQGWMGREWHLVEGERVVATLRWRGWSGGFDIVVEGTPWVIHSEGLWGRRLIATDPASRRLALRVGWGGGEIEGHAWGSLRLLRPSWGSRSLDLEAPGRGRLARTTMRWGSADVEVDPRLPDGLLLACLAWGFLLMAHASSSAGG